MIFNKKYELFGKVNIPNFPVIAEIKLDNYNEIEKYLDKPFDNVFSSILEVAASATAEYIGNCSMFYCTGDTILFSFNDNVSIDLQKFSSTISSKMSLEFYKNFMIFIMDYQDRVDKTWKDYNDDEKELIKHRIEYLWKAIDTSPIFTCRATITQTHERAEILSELQANGLTNALIKIWNKFFGEKVPENITKEDISLRLGNEYPEITIYDILPEREEFGSIGFKNSDGDWESTVSLTFLEGDENE